MLAAPEVPFCSVSLAVQYDDLSYKGHVTHLVVALQFMCLAKQDAPHRQGSEEAFFSDGAGVLDLEAALLDLGLEHRHRGLCLDAREF